MNPEKYTNQLEAAEDEILEMRSHIQKVEEENQRLRDALQEAQTICHLWNPDASLKLFEICTLMESIISKTEYCVTEALKPSPAPQPDTQDEKLSPTPLEDCNWLCEGCGWTGVELTYVDVEDAHKRFHSKQGTRCKHGGLKLRITWPLSESSAPQNSLVGSCLEVAQQEAEEYQKQIKTLTAERDALIEILEYIHPDVLLRIRQVLAESTLKSKS